MPELAFIIYLLTFVSCNVDSVHFNWAKASVITKEHIVKYH